MSQSPDVVIVGAGIVGASCARELSRDGARVVVLERHGGWASPEAASWGNAGLIVPSHAAPIASPANLRAGLRWLGRRDAPLALRLRPALVGWLRQYVRACSPERARRAEHLQRALAVDGLRRLRSLADEGLDFGFLEAGCLSAHTGPRAGAAADAEAGSAAGRVLGAIRLHAVATREMEPALDVDAGVGAGVLFPHEAQCDPVRLVGALGEQAVASGASLATGVGEIRLRRERGGVVVESSAGALRAGAVVVAAGAWSASLAGDLGVPLPLQGGKGYTVEWSAPAAQLRRPVYLHTERMVATPIGDRLRLTGGMVLEGLDPRLDPRRIVSLRAVARRCFGVGAPPDVSWRGLRPCTPDGLPVIGAHPAAPEVIFATGHGMLGITLGPLTGRMVADVLAGGTPDPRFSSLSPGRFGCATWRGSGSDALANPGVERTM